MIASWTKKPVSIQAIEFTGLNIGEIVDWCAGAAVGTVPHSADPLLTIKTLEGNMKVSKGDFVIRGIEGEFYPCRGDIFRKTYEPTRIGW